MSRTPIAAALALALAVAACQAGSPPSSRAARRAATPSPAVVRLPPAAQAILSDQAVGAARRAGQDHLTPEQAASAQADQAAALTEYRSWAWVDGASRTWDGAGETLVITARADRAERAFEAWSAGTDSPCAAAAAAALDGCRLGVSGDRAVVVGRLASAVFRLDCPAAAAERLAAAQAASLRA